MKWSHLQTGSFFLAGYIVLFAVLAVAPVDRKTWALENALAVVFVAGLVASARALPLSRISYGCLFVFLSLHTVGAHYEYSNVPYDAWSRIVLPGGLDALLGWDRNHFDRAIHFMYGLLLAYPLREVFLRIVDVRGFWGVFLPLQMVLSTSLVYEVIEWAAAVVFGGDLGVAYLGTQGDEWDAQKDMALAGAGALLTLLLVVGVNLAWQRDFAREWIESVRVKHGRPLGEDRLRELRSGRSK